MRNNRTHRGNTFYEELTPFADGIRALPQANTGSTRAALEAAERERIARAEAKRARRAAKAKP